MMSPFAAGMVATAGAEARTGQGLFRTTRDNAGSPGNELAVRYGDRMRFVGAATRRISRGIDLDEIMMGLCRATVPTFADTILIYLRDPLPAGEERLSGPILLRLARTEEAPFHASIVGTTPWDPPLAAPPHVPVAAAGTCGVRAGGALAHVLRGVRPVLGDGAGREALEELLSKDFDMPGGCRSLLAPLRGRRRVVGVAVFLRRRERLAFEEEDLLAAGQLATQTALGIDKAALYGREAYIADELQRSMLPESLPHVAGIHLASRYLPAAETIRVGGDWYDAILLPRGRVALVVGDVMGHSMRSAAIMGQLRTSVQTLAGLGLPPHELLQQLDDQAMRLGSDRVATCLYAVYDPVSHRIAIASAGHPPPILLHPGGRAEVLDVPPGAPIGVGAADFGVDFETVELGVPADSTLLLYTDGLVESRHKDIWTGIEQVRKQAAATAQPSSLRSVPEVEILCDDLLDLLGPGERDDDIALLAAQLLGITESDAAHWSLDNTVTAPRDARRLVRQVLERWGLHGLVGDAELLVSELVTNSVNATSMLVEPIEVSLLRTHVLRCEVRDRSLDLPSRRRAQPMDEFGRGLRVIQDLAQRWGVSRLVGSKVVWFEIELDWAD
ncbi:ATP-binding SpoIIE family protein phosphatase [Streptomyces sp. SAS_275]|uniref:ATP-binding SpoIIE family protein phosphatase n=1 Tax=Streptomyces sp. SAS_275 TaxID=3412746 RepID=UPI00403C8062